MDETIDDEEEKNGSPSIYIIYAYFDDETMVGNSTDDEVDSYPVFNEKLT